MEQQFQKLLELRQKKEQWQLDYGKNYSSVEEGKKWRCLLVFLTSCLALNGSVSEDLYKVHNLFG